MVRAIANKQAIANYIMKRHLTSIIHEHSMQTFPQTWILHLINYINSQHEESPT